MHVFQTGRFCPVACANAPSSLATVTAHCTPVQDPHARERSASLGAASAKHISISGATAEHISSLIQLLQEDFRQTCSGTNFRTGLHKLPFE